MSDPLDIFRIEGRVAVVTGAASGIGRAVGEVLAAAGARVVLGDLDGPGAQAVAEGIRGQGGRAAAQRVDVAEKSEQQALVALAIREFGQLDVGSLWPTNSS